MFVVALQSLASKLPWSLLNLSFFTNHRSKSHSNSLVFVFRARKKPGKLFKNQIIVFYFCQKIKLTLKYRLV